MNRDIRKALPSIPLWPLYIAGVGMAAIVAVHIGEEIDNHKSKKYVEHVWSLADIDKNGYIDDAERGELWSALGYTEPIPSGKPTIEQLRKALKHYQGIDRDVE